jgi:hypothetical protein
MCEGAAMVHATRERGATNLPYGALGAGIGCWGMSFLPVAGTIAALCSASTAIVCGAIGISVLNRPDYKWIQSRTRLLVCAILGIVFGALFIVGFAALALTAMSESRF